MPLPLAGNVLAPHARAKIPFFYRAIFCFFC